MMKKFASAVLVVFVLAACQTNMGQKQGAGTLVGAGLGALAGSQVGSGRGQMAAVAIGALLGAWAGGEVGKSLDAADRAAMSRAEVNARTAPIGQTVSWDNPDSGHRGTVTPTREGTHNRTGARCREFRQTVTIKNRTEEALGTACQQADGSWKIMN
jgi:surface antigen